MYRSWLWIFIALKDSGAISNTLSKWFKISSTLRHLASLIILTRQLRSLGTAQRAGFSIPRYPSTSGSTNGSSWMSSLSWKDCIHVWGIHHCLDDWDFVYCLLTAGSDMLSHSNKVAAKVDKVYNCSADWMHMQNMEQSHSYHCHQNEPQATQYHKKVHKVVRRNYESGLAIIS